MGTALLPPNQARQQQAAGWGKSAAAVGLVSWLPESDEWSRRRKKPTKVSLILMQLFFFFPGRPLNENLSLGPFSLADI